MVASSTLIALAAYIALQGSTPAKAWSAADVPAQAQVISPKSFAVLGVTNILPPTQANATTVRKVSRKLGANCKAFCASRDECELADGPAIPYLRR